jgi:hypothetical protein
MDFSTGGLNNFIPKQRTQVLLPHENEMWAGVSCTTEAKKGRMMQDGNAANRKCVGLLTAIKSVFLMIGMKR